MKIYNDVPKAEEFVRLRELAGLSTKKLESAKKGLANTIYSVIIRTDEDELIGMGRLVGDGGTVYRVVDIAVHPNYQGIGLGKEIMSKITKFINDELDETAYISLIADVPANHLYEKFGFIETAPKSIGMYFKKHI